MILNIWKFQLILISWGHDVRTWHNNTWESGFCIGVQAAVGFHTKETMNNLELSFEINILNRFNFFLLINFLLRLEFIDLFCKRIGAYIGLI